MTEIVRYVESLDSDIELFDQEPIKLSGYAKKFSNELDNFADKFQQGKVSYQELQKMFPDADFDDEITIDDIMDDALVYISDRNNSYFKDEDSRFYAVLDDSRENFLQVPEGSCVSCVISDDIDEDEFERISEILAGNDNVTYLNTNYQEIKQCEYKGIPYIHVEEDPNGEEFYIFRKRDVDKITNLLA